MQILPSSSLAGVRAVIAAMKERLSDIEKGRNASDSSHDETPGPGVIGPCVQRGEEGATAFPQRHGAATLQHQGWVCRGAGGFQFWNVL